MSNAGHPKNFDYEQCVQCLCWRPVKELRFLQLVTPSDEPTAKAYECFDREVCMRLRAT